jgi:TolB-like protein
VTEPSRAVFISYASQDAEAATRICAALRAAGIEVWFDQNELRGGDVWDQKIKRQIRDCALFIPLISANTASRHEGYFRLEWDLADERTHRMARDRAFIVPVSLDAARGSGSDMPESFHRAQWTRLPGGETPPEFVARIARLLSPELETTARSHASTVSRSPPMPLARGSASPLRRVLPIALAVLVVAALGFLLADKLRSQHGPSAPPAVSSEVIAPPPAAIAFNPPPHSIAVLPFVNMSGDKEQEYFSDGLSEELLNDLAHINELQVAARTSAFSFKGKDTDIGTIAKKLNVGAVLEGSVRRSAHTVRVTAQLINAVNGFHMWSQTYDRGLGDVLRLQTEIAEAVANALKVTILGETVGEMKVGGTRNAAAYDAYLRSARAYWQQHTASDMESVIAGYKEALRLDPNFALAYAEWSFALQGVAAHYAHGPAVYDVYRQARATALKAVELAPNLAEGHLALALVYQESLDFTNASKEFDRAIALAPGSARVLRDYSGFAVWMGNTERGIVAAQRAVALDPLNPNSHYYLSEALRLARRYDEALAAYQGIIPLVPNDREWPAIGYLIFYALGDFEKMRSLCEGIPTVEDLQDCRALAYHKLGRQADANAALARYKAREGNTGAYGCAIVYAQWGNVREALDWLEAALRLRDPGLKELKTEPLLDPLRNEPRFKAIQRELKFPD